MSNRCLVVEGGGFKTGFSAGVLDAFISAGYHPFNQYLGVSGGAIALSYYLSKQYRFCISAMKVLANDQQFTNYKRTFGSQGYMDIDYLAKIYEEEFPFEFQRAFNELDDAEIAFVATNRENGNPAYLRPDASNWIDAVIASCTLPFVTKGRHVIGQTEYFDGGWSDPLPVKYAYDQGAREVVIVRTWPAGIRSTQSWADYFGSIYFSSSPSLKSAFANCHKKYNEAIDFMSNPPDDLTVHQIAPNKVLKSGTYAYSNKTIMNDYRYGLDKGLVYLNKRSYSI